MENARIKEILLDIAPTELDFTVVQTGKESKRVNGLYAPDTHEILLHNKNFKTDNQLVYTAVHEYAHHLNAEELIRTTGNPSAPYNSKVHNQAFWARFDALLSVAEEKGYYVIGLERSPELAELTEKIRRDYLEANGRLMQEFGKLLVKAHELCEAADIRYEDYIDRVLCMPRNTAKDICRVAATDVNPAIGFDNMKIVAAVRKKDERAAVEQEFLDGKGPVAVRELMRQKSAAAHVSPKEKLEREKSRLEKTIEQLSKRLEFVEESLAAM
ncbi:MAG: hypothetical protein K2H09_05455 [Treponemataceae bacterium]|nr:hypothetical protein [Treponemataceae bacterium]